MLVTNHVLSGAVIGAAARRPLPAFLIGVASHFVLDAMPHWGQWDDDERFFRVAVADGLTGLAAMSLVTRGVLKGGQAGGSGSGRGRLAASVLAGMAGAALPDLDKPSDMLLGHQLWPDAVNRFHRAIQDEAPHRFFSHEVVAAAGFALTAAALIRRRMAR
ncbi:MAG: metal-dependent hydrolase [Catenulisporales bacterium]|nr:metal-dependent hydrolase [Catenulisporales bacterium]